MKSTCGKCGAVFSSESTFNRHRVGKYTQTGPDYGRRCLTPSEMVLDGMRLVNEVWRGEEMPAGGRAWGRISHDQDVPCTLQPVGGENG